MKNTDYRVWTCLAGALLCGVAAACAQEATARPTNVLNTRVAPLEAATPTETLLALAKAADINLLADVDDAQTPISSREAGDKARTLFAELNSLSRARNWSWQRVSDQTFLLWKQPDTVALARQIMADEAAANAPTIAGAPNAVTAAPAVGEVTSEPINVALTRYFATPAARNDADNPASWRAVPLLELPPALRERIIESARGAQRGGLQFAAAGAVVSDEFWKTAVLQVREMNVPAPRPPQTQKRTPAEIIAAAKAPAEKRKFLFVVGQFERQDISATTMLSIGRWNEAPAQ